MRVSVANDLIFSVSCYDLKLLHVPALLHLETVLISSSS